MHPQQQELINGLRELADYLANHEFDASSGVGFSNVDVYLFTDGDGFLTNVKRMGGFKRNFSEYAAEATRQFGPVKFTLHTDRGSVCEKVEVGVKVIPAQPERIIPAEPEKVVKAYEYRCPESLLGGTVDQGF